MRSVFSGASSESCERVDPSTGGRRGGDPLERGRVLHLGVGERCEIASMACKGRPASMRLRSSMSVTSRPARRDSPCSRSARRCWRRDSGSSRFWAEAATCSAAACMPAIGVRSSWAASARNRRVAFAGVVGGSGKALPWIPVRARTQPMSATRLGIMSARPRNATSPVASDRVSGGVCCEALGAAVGAEPEVIVVVAQMVGGGAWVDADTADRIGGVLRRR